MNPHPSPKVGALPAWTGLGHWHTERFVSLVLTKREWEDAVDPRDGEWSFVHEAVITCRQFTTAAVMSQPMPDQLTAKDNAPGR